MAMGCRQWVPLSVVQLKGKHCRKPHCRNGVVDTFEQTLPKGVGMANFFTFSNGFAISNFAIIEKITSTSLQNFNV